MLFISPDVSNGESVSLQTLIKGRYARYWAVIRSYNRRKLPVVPVALPLSWADT